MKIVINIYADTFLLCHEALSMAFALAAFDHQIQLTIGDGMLNLLLDAPTGKLAHMLASLDMYDMPPVWLALADFDSKHGKQTNQQTLIGVLKSRYSQPQRLILIPLLTYKYYDPTFRT